MGPSFPRWTIVTLVAASIMLIPLAVLLGCGLLDSLSKDGTVDQRAAGSVVVYWLLLCLLISGIASFRTGMREGVLYITSTALGIGALELGLVTFELFPERTFEHEHGVSSPRFHHLLPANSKLYQGKYEGKDVIFRTNSDGLRTTYTRETFQKHPTRIAILGDSYTVGFGVQQDKAFPAALEKRLHNELNQLDLAVLNAGITSSSPFLQKLLYAGVIRDYKPGIVISMLDVTDFGDDYKYSREEIEGENPVRFNVQPSRFHYFGALHQWFAPYFEYPWAIIAGFYHPQVQSARAYQYQELQLDIDGVRETNRFFILRHARPFIQPFLKATLRNIQELADEVHHNGAKFILVVSPRYQHWNVKECPKTHEAWMYSTSEPFQFEYLKFFDEVKDSVDFPIFNLLPAFLATQEFPMVFEDDAHWNERGHAFVSTVLEEYLLRNHMVQ